MIYIHHALRVWDALRDLRHWVIVARHHRHQH